MFDFKTIGICTTVLEVFVVLFDFVVASLILYNTSKVIILYYFVNSFKIKVLTLQFDEDFLKIAIQYLKYPLTNRKLKTMKRTQPMNINSQSGT